MRIILTVPSLFLMVSFFIATVTLAFGIKHLKNQNREHDRIKNLGESDQHPSLRPKRFEFVLQPEPSRHAYRGPTAIRIKPNRHRRKRNKT